MNTTCIVELIGLRSLRNSVAPLTGEHSAIAAVLHSFKNNGYKKSQTAQLTEVSNDASVNNR